MPLRGDFDYEHENDAELLLADMEFNEDDEENFIKTKYEVLKIYYQKLKERKKRKEFIISRNKLNFEKNFLKEKQMTSLEREIRNELKPYERFISYEEHEELV